VEVVNRAAHAAVYHSRRVNMLSGRDSAREC
jgi:hypothetical protein